MIIAGHPYEVLAPGEIELIYGSTLTILEKIGMEIQNEPLLIKLAEAGLPVDFGSERVRFPALFVERFIAETEKYDWEHHIPRVSASAGVYHSLYQDPFSGQLVPWDENRLAFYFSLARQLPHIGIASMLGSRLPGPYEPLAERYWCWKYGAEEGGSIYLDELCPFLLELYQMRAVEQDKPLEQVFHANVYLVPALKLGKHEAYQVMYFKERGLRVNIGGGMLTMGATAPVTLSGAVTLNLAEQLALGILDRILWGRKTLHLGSSIAAMDMRTTIRPFGRPEMAFANLMTAQIARFLGASFDGHAGLADAKLPSGEASAQKAISAVSTLLAGGSLWMDAGLLGIDEVCSPVQMALDNELLSVLKQFIHEFQVSEETLGLESILEAGPGGQYLNREHTARYFRNEIWEPSIWSREMLQTWREAGSRLDVEKARQTVMDLYNTLEQRSQISEQLEAQILGLVRRAQNMIYNFG